MAKQSHHYVPQVYLRGFYDPKRVAQGVNALWRYRSGGQPQERGSKKVAAQTNFYDLPEVDPAENDVEEMFSDVERIVAPNLKKLRDGKLPHRSQDKAHLAGYFALQYTRTPWFRKLTNKSYISLRLAVLKGMLEEIGGLEKFLEHHKFEAGKDYKDVESLKAYMAKVVQGEVPVEQRNKAWNAKVMLEHSDRVGKQLFATRWNLLEAPDGAFFITSDNPVHLIDPAVLRRGPDGYEPSKDFQFVVPVSPRFGLIGERQAGPDQRLMVTPGSVDKFNLATMERAEELYASVKSPGLQARFDEIVKTRPPSIRELPQDYLKRLVDRVLDTTRTS